MAEIVGSGRGRAQALAAISVMTNGHDPLGSSTSASAALAGRDAASARLPVTRWTRAAPVRNEVASITVPACDGMSADAWATALLVAGPTDGLALAQRIGLEALFLLRRPGGWVELGLERFGAVAPRRVAGQGGAPPDEMTRRPVRRRAACQAPGCVVATSRRPSPLLKKYSPFGLITTARWAAGLEK